MQLKAKVAIHCHAKARTPARYRKRIARDREVSKVRSRASTRIAGTSKTWLYGAYMGTTSTVSAITSEIAAPNFSAFADSPRSFQSKNPQASTRTTVTISENTPGISNTDWF